VSNVEKFYDQNAQEEWDRLERHKVEFQVTRQALIEFLPAAPAGLITLDEFP
jgi:hypothetical protein